MLGLAMLGVSSLAFAFAGHIVLLDGARFIQGIGGACMWAAGMAWLVSAAPVERRGELIGAALSAAIVGVLLGPVLGGAATLLSPEAVFSAVSVARRGARRLGVVDAGRRAGGEPRHRGDAARASAARRCWRASGCSRSRRSSPA